MVTARAYKFILNGKELRDPAIGQPLSVKLKMLQMEHPELANADYSVEATKEADVITFNKKIGTYA